MKSLAKVTIFSVLALSLLDCSYTQEIDDTVSSKSTLFRANNDNSIDPPNSSGTIIVSSPSGSVESTLSSDASETSNSSTMNTSENTGSKSSDATSTSSASNTSTSFESQTSSASSTSTSLDSTASNTSTSTSLNSSISSTSTSTTSSASTLPSLGSRYLDQRCGSGIGSCAPGLCCSGNGYCGYTSDHCGAGCQTTFGGCDDGMEATVYTACQAPGNFAITFDDGPSVLTPGLLDYLDRVGVKSTFFMNGNNWKNQGTGNPLKTIYELSDVVKRAYADGHQICSHTWSHVNLMTVNEYNVTYEMSKLNRAFANILGVVPTCMRPPYGDTDGNSRKVLKRMGFTVVTWNMNPVDWNPTNSIDEMYMEYVYQSGNTSPLEGKFISLNHDVWNTTADFRFPNYPKTLPMAQRVVEYLKCRGWRLVSLPTCMGEQPYYRSPNPSDESCGDSCFD